MKIFICIGLLAFVASCAVAPKKDTLQAITWEPEATRSFSAADMDLFKTSIAKAAVWTEPNFDSFDMEKSAGFSEGGPWYKKGETILCAYNKEITEQKKSASGVTPKFWCNISGDNKEIKVKYFSKDPNDNREVFAAAVSTRLYRALGFLANRVYSVSVECTGCTEDPWAMNGNKARTTPFSPAVVEYKPKGKKIDGTKEGWAWKELDQIDPSLAEPVKAKMRMERGALKLLSAFVQHGDNKAEQQSMVCLSDLIQVGGKTVCENPVAYVHDLGATWGGAGGTTNKVSAKMNFKSFTDECMWKQGGALTPNLKSSFAGSLKDGELSSISEESRKFLHSLLVQFGSKPERVRAMFEAAQVDELHKLLNEKTTVDHWVSSFNLKVNELGAKSCFTDTRKKLVDAAKNGAAFPVALNKN